MRSVVFLVGSLLLLGCEPGTSSSKSVHPIPLALNSDFIALEAPLQPAIIPKPKHVTTVDEQFELSGATPIVAQGETVKIAEYLQTQFGPATGYPLPIVDHADGAKAIHLVIDSAMAGAESYQLVVSADAIELRAATVTGLFWAVQSLRQLLPAEIEAKAVINKAYWPIGGVVIEDEPAFSYRGMHLDVSRTFFPVSFIKQYIDLLALHKMNIFHWHLTDDQGWRIEIKQFPRLTSVGAWRDETVVGHTYDRDGLYDKQRLGGFYSQVDIRDIVAYAAARQITIIPEIDVPGHASAILQAYPEFACVEKPFAVQGNFGVFPEVLCPTEKTFAFLDAVFTEVVGLFPSPYIHIGGDEVKTSQWQTCSYCSDLMKQENLKDYFALQGYFIKRVETTLNKLGRNIVGWDEILEGGVGPSATITSWRGIDGAIHAAKAGHDVIMAPGSHLYFDHYQSRSIDEPFAIHGLTPVSETYSFQVIPDELKGTDAARFVLGAQGHLWTEYVRTPAKAQYMVLPRMSALSEVVWSEAAQQSWPDFAARLPALIGRFEAMGLNVAKSVYAVNTAVTHDDAGFHVQLTSDMPDVNIHYTLDGSEPNHSSPVYIQPLALPHGATLRARAQQVATGEMFVERRLSLIEHKALGAKVTLLNDADRSWNTKPEQSLVDGILARDQIFQLDDWATFPGDALGAVIEFASSAEVSELNIGFNPGRYRHFYAPTALQVLGSVDGEIWQELAVLSAQEIDLNRVSATVNFPPVSVNYLKILVENSAQRFSTEDSQPVQTTLYIDELIVN